MAKAICPDCGDPRADPTDACRTCGWNPYVSDEEMAKSLYLSTARFHGEPSRRQSEYERELDEIGTAIDRGSPFDFTKVDLAALRARARKDFPPPPAPIAAFVLGTLICVGIIGLVIWFLYFVSHPAR